MILVVSFRRLPILLLGIVVMLFIGLSSSASSVLSDRDLDAMASQTTVVMAKQLEKGDVENKKYDFYPGSGVIIARQGNTYYVLTNNHVVREKNDRPLGIRTADGEVYKVADDGNNIVRFAKFTGEESLIRGFDIALVKFTSDRNYEVAVMGDSSKLRSNNSVYISGWPNPENGDKRRERVFREGKVAKITSFADTKNGGYSFMYSNKTRSGMSGGPVFNSQGELVGIHGKGRKRGNNYCVDPNLNANNSCGVQQLHLISLPEVARIRSAFSAPPVTLSVVEKGRKNKAKADVVEDIYKLFTLGALRRDAGVGSGGCGSLLLGDKCPQ